MTEDKRKQILSRMERYCAREDRSVQKIREKLYVIEDLSPKDQEEIIISLLDDNFLDDTRFVEAYIRSKINQNKWGKQKIRHGLIRHRISEDKINRGLAEMNRETYRLNLQGLLVSKQRTTDDSTAWIRYLLQKGYEYDEILEEIGN